MTCVAAIALLAIDPRPWIERYANARLDRLVTIGALQIRWRTPILIEASDLRLANAAWGSRPDMVRIERVTAEIDPLAAFGNRPWLRVVDVVRPDIVLERGPNGVGNWRLADRAPASASPTPGPRTLLPALLQGRVRDGGLSFRTSSGAMLRIGVRALDLRAADAAQPVTVEAEGSYNGTPVRLSVRAPSFDDMRAKPGPLAVTFAAATAMVEVNFIGTMIDPLDFEGIDGALDIDASHLVATLNILGAGAAADDERVPLKLAGRFRRTGDHWDLVDAKGRLLADDFTGALSLAEAGRGEPDEIDIAARFDRLDLEAVLERSLARSESRPGAEGDADLLAFDHKRGTHFDVRLEAVTLAVRAQQLSDFALVGRLASDGARIDRLSFVFAGGAVGAAGSARPVADGSRIAATIEIEEADAGRIARLLGAGGGQVTGRITGRAEIEAVGRTLEAAARSSRGHAVVAMTQGRIARRLLEMASTDLRSVFRRDERQTRISCLLGVATLEDGRAAISRLRLETPVTTLVGGGHVNVVEGHLDVTVKSIASSTGFFALDIPIRVTGPLARPRFDPLLGDSASWLDGGAGRPASDGLPARLQQLVDGNRCAR